MNQRLEFDGIEKSFQGHTVLSSIHMVCVSGMVTGLLGRNGSGKSTLMKIVFGTMPASCKSIRVNGKPLLNNYLRQRIIGYLPQQKFIPQHMKVSQALTYYGIESGCILDSFPEFTKWLNESVRNLSGGYSRILETMLILKSRHQFVMLDEPFSGLMPLHIEILKKAIVKEKSSKGIIISDHLFRHVLDIGDKTYLLTNGKTYLIKDQEELMNRGYVPDQEGLSS